MSATIAGLIGVVIGGLLTGLSQFVLARLDTDRAAKVGARLLMHELTFLQRNFASRLDDPKADDFFARPGYERLTSVWQDQRGVLCAVLGYADWLTVSRAILGLNLVFSPQMFEELSRDTRANLVKRLEDASRVLKPVAERHGQLQLARLLTRHKVVPEEIPNEATSTATERN